MKKILITGGAGFIGSNSALHFAKNKWKIYLIDNLSRKGSKDNLSKLKKITLNTLMTMNIEEKRNLGLKNIVEGVEIEPFK